MEQMSVRQYENVCDMNFDNDSYVALNGGAQCT